MSISVTGVVRADLTKLDHYEQGRALQSLTAAPAGATVEIVVRPGQFYNHSGLRDLMDNGDNLSVIVVCPDAKTVGNWVRALRGA